MKIDTRHETYRQKTYFRQAPDWILEKLFRNEIAQTSVILLLYLQYHARGRRDWITMPSYREIQDSLSMSPSTISQCLRELVQVGVITRFTQRGERSAIKIELSAPLSEEGAPLSEEGAPLSEEGATLSEEGATLSEEGATLSEEVSVRFSHERKKDSKEVRVSKSARTHADVTASRAWEKTEACSLAESRGVSSVSALIKHIKQLQESCRSP